MGRLNGVEWLIERASPQHYGCKASFAFKGRAWSSCRCP